MTARIAAAVIETHLSRRTGAAGAFKRLSEPNIVMFLDR